MENTVKDSAPRPLKRTIALIIALMMILVALELLYSSRKEIALMFSGAKPQTLPLENAVCGGNAKYTQNGIKITGEGTVTFTLSDPAEIKYIRLDLSGPESYALIKVYAKDSAWQSSYKLYQTENVYLGENAAVIGYDSAGKTTAFQLKFPAEAKGAVIKSVTLNRAYGLRFNFLRWFIAALITAAVFAAWHFRLHKKIFACDSRFIKITALAAALFCAVSAVLGHVKETGFDKYPFEKPVEKYTCYQQQTDALLKGRLDLDITFDPAELEELENPYDYGVRKAETKSFYSLWDRAYNEDTGKVYSYFGIAPVLLFYLPVTAITGYMPRDGTASLVFTIAATFAFVFALLAAMRRFKINADPVTLFLACSALCCGSFIYVLNVHPSMYYSAVICGMLFFALTLNFAFRAACAQNPSRRKLHLALAGVCVVLTVASRPNALLFAVMLLPAFIDLFFMQKRPVKTKIVEFAFIAVPVFMGAVLIMIYNAARFGSPFDFGTTRQLTFYDMGYCGLEIYKFFPSLYHYFIQPVGFTAEFPFMDIASNNLGVYRGYEYVYRSAGALNFAAVWGNFAILPVTKGDKIKRWTYISAVAAAVFVAFADFCLAGTHLRYMGDIMFPLCLVGALVLCEIVQLSAQSRYASHVRAAVWIIFVLTLLVSSALLFANEADNIKNLAPHTFRAFEKLFE